VGPKADLDDMEKGKFLFLAGIDPRLLGFLSHLRHLASELKRSGQEVEIFNG
jgi:hypothetical protein